MNTISYNVIEDNAGSLYFFVWENDILIYGSPMLAEDVAGAIANVENCRSWESLSDDAAELYDTITGYDYGWEVVADENGVYSSVMGASACEAFAL